MKIQPHTIVVMVGPSNSGKTHFCKNKLIPALENFDSNYLYLSSDDIRADLCGYTNKYDKYSRQMWAVSKQAFEILETKLRCAVSYPVNKDVVVVDGTGLREDFRSKIQALAKEHSYSVLFLLFDYKTEEYYQVEGDLSVIKKHVDQFKREVLPLRSSMNDKYSSVHVITSRDNATALHIEVIDRPKNFLTLDTDKYAVVGDVHGSLEALKKMIEETKRFKKVVFVGDIIDKAVSTKDMEECLKILLSDNRFVLVLGNHENFFVKDAARTVDLPEGVRESYFTSTINPSQELVDLVNCYYERSYDGVITNDAVVTHSPCPVKHLLKHDADSIRRQRNYRYTSEGKTLEETLAFINDEQSPFYKFHIWGHIALDRYFVNKGNIGIDTGACYGNYLTAVYFDRGKPKFIKVKSENVTGSEGALKSLSFAPDETKKNGSYDPRTVRKAQQMIDRGVRYLSPTMSPADKLENDLESFDWAIDYYKKAGVTSVCIQPKFMGSRAQVYLHKDISKCYSISRNGFRIKDELNDQLLKEYERLNNLDFVKTVRMDTDVFVVLDCELLPWSAMASGLIDKTFSGYSWLYRGQIENREDLKFFELIDSMKSRLPLQDYSNLSKKDFIEKHGHHNYENCKGFKYISENIVDNKDVDLANLDAFDKQVSDYSVVESPYFEPFDFLGVFAEGRAILTSHNPETSGTVFGYINSNPNYSGPIGEAKSALEAIVGNYSKPLEGFVVKPLVGWKEGTAPYLKVRNPEYLRMVYGPDYLDSHKYSKLIGKKRVGFKLADSIREYEANSRLLAATEESFLDAMCNCIVTKEGGKNGDPRF